MFQEGQPLVKEIIPEELCAGEQLQPTLHEAPGLYPEHMTLAVMLPG